MTWLLGHPAKAGSCLHRDPCEEGKTIYIAAPCSGLGAVLLEQQQQKGEGGWSSKRATAGEVIQGLEAALS